MQYLLTEKEYRELKYQRLKEASEDKKKLQELCTLAAMHVPVDCEHEDADGSPVRMPWGCILVEDASQDICDLCPAVDVCPCDRKEFSQ